MLFLAAFLNKYKAKLIKVGVIFALLLAVAGFTAYEMHQHHAKLDAQAQAVLKVEIQKALGAAQVLQDKADKLATQRDEAAADALVAKTKAAASKAALNALLKAPQPEPPKDLSPALVAVTNERDAAVVALNDETVAHAKDLKLLDLTTQQLGVVTQENTQLKSSLTSQIQLTAKVTDDWNTEKTWHRRWKNVSFSLSLFDAGAALATRIRTK